MSEAENGVDEAGKQAAAAFLGYIATLARERRDLRPLRELRFTLTIWPDAAGGIERSAIDVTPRAADKPDQPQRVQAGGVGFRPPAT